jgi:transglutaminase-like putative cysteine protease
VKGLLYEVSHTTAYEYTGPVSVSHHLLRLAPRENGRQTCLKYDVVISPTAETISLRSDYFGNPTHFIEVQSPHQKLVIHSRSQVVVSPAFIPEPSETPAWEAVRARCRDDHSGQTLEAHEFTYPSQLIPAAEDIADYAKASFPRSRPILDAVTDLTARIREDFTFDPAATTVTTPLSDVVRLRRGVCQDFAHFQIACLRAQGLPARYVSGYLETDPPPGQPKLRGVDASHAWVSFYCPGMGWIDVDPTNNCLPSLRHIAVAWGRDFSDVCPTRGVLIGGESQKLTVSVDVTALGPLETTAAGENAQAN